MVDDLHQCIDQPEKVPQTDSPMVVGVYLVLFLIFSVLAAKPGKLLYRGQSRSLKTRENKSVSDTSSIGLHSRGGKRE